MNESLNKDPEIVLEAAPLFILDSKSDVCMSNNGKDTNHNSHIARRVQFVRNGENVNCTRFTGMKKVCNWHTSRIRIL